MNYERDYMNLVTRVICDGQQRESRVGPTYSIFGTMLEIDSLEKGQFPILTQRKMYPAPVWGELAAFLTGSTQLQTFKDFGCNYWNDNAANWPPNEKLAPEDHLVGNIYGYQWKHWAGKINQIENLIDGIHASPSSRRHLLTTYDPADLGEMCLPPCHLLAQFNVGPLKIDCIVYMRSVDLCLGLPSDVVLYATLLLLVCQQTGYEPGKLTFMMADSHVYTTHVPAFWDHGKQTAYRLPTWELNNDSSIEFFAPNDIILVDYQYSEPIKYVLLA